MPYLVLPAVEILSNVQNIIFSKLLQQKHKVGAFLKEAALQLHRLGAGNVADMKLNAYATKSILGEAL